MSEETRKGAKSCPICGRPATLTTRPFCSRRCANVDLHRWLSESYALPVAQTDAEEEDESGATDRSPPPD